MHGDCTSLPAHWDYYLQRSREAETARYDDLGQGREEQLNEVLAAIEADVPFDSDHIGRLDRLPWNRAKKYRRLRARLTASADSSQDCAIDPGAPLDRATLLEAVRRQMTPAQWNTERRLALGETYADLARTVGMSEAAVKVRVHRWREGVRSAIGRSHRFER